MTRAQEAEEMIQMEKSVCVMKRRVAELEKEKEELQHVCEDTHTHTRTHTHTITFTCLPPQQLENSSANSSVNDTPRKRSTSVPAYPPSPTSRRRFRVSTTRVLSEEEIDVSVLWWCSLCI